MSQKNDRMEDDVEEMKIKISRLENLLRVANERISKLEQQVIPLVHARAEERGATITFDGDQKSLLGKSLGQMYQNTVTTRYPLGGAGRMPDDE